MLTHVRLYSEYTIRYIAGSFVGRVGRVAII